jgi:hypothetical protein
MDAKGSQADRRERLNDQEVNQGKDGGENDVLKPPHPPIELAQVLANQTVLMEAIFNTVNCPRPRVLGMNEKLIEFLRTKPPTFGRSVNPLDADDWLRAILRELEPFLCEDRDKVLLATHQLTRTALAWWEIYCAAAKDPSAITWDEFVEEFRRYHIPEATLKRKADEFCELRQGNKSVEEYTYKFIELAHYAPEEVDKDSKKQKMFKKGLTPELRTLLTPQIYSDFNTLMNMSILTERARQKRRKRTGASSWSTRLNSKSAPKGREASDTPCPDSKPPCSIEHSPKPRDHKAPKPSSNRTTTGTP